MTINEQFFTAKYEARYELLELRFATYWDLQDFSFTNDWSLVVPVIIDDVDVRWN